MMRGTLIAMSRSRWLARQMTTSRVAWFAASRFVAGQTIGEAVPVVKQLNVAGMRASLDYLGENVATRAEAEEAAGAYREALDAIQAAGIQSGISLKLTALGMDLSDELAAEMLRGIVAHAAAMDPVRYVRIDMEGSPYTARTLDVFERIFKDFRNVGVVIQAYLYRSAEDIERLIGLGAGVRLCKGAYLEPEEVAFPAKGDVDANYLKLAELLLSPDALAKGVYPAVASHDEAILAWVKRHVGEIGVPRDKFEFQMLFGVRRDLQQALVGEGYRMRVYVPYGLQWYPYFMRRMAERPENMGFVLRNMVRELRS